MKRLNLGCGTEIIKDCINCDIIKLKGVNKVFDIDKTPYKFKSNTFDEVYALSVLEHLTNIVDVMNEIHRILKQNGKVIISIPHFTSHHNFRDPTHKHCFSFKCFNYFVREDLWYNNKKFSSIRTKLTFGKKYALWNYIIEPLANIFPDVYESTFLKVFPAEELKIVMVK
jgi:SAM-dependent methyltransferase